MAYIVPGDISRLALAGCQAPELETLERLRRELGPDYTVFHSVHWTRDYRGRTLWGEADFVVLNRAGELLVIEQKNGRLDETGGGLRKHYRAGPSKDPFTQVRRSVDNIRQKFSENREREPRLAVDYLVYCPDHRVRSLNAVGLDASRLVDAADDRRLARRIAGILGPGIDNPSRRAGVDAFLRDSCDVVPDVHAHVRKGETRFARLGGRLSELVAGIEMTPLRLRVRGAAGCGKTLIAGQFYHRALEASKRPLLVCFNRQLMERMRASVGEGGLVETWHGLCNRFLTDIGQEPDFSGKGRYDDAFWERIQEQVTAATIPQAWLFDIIIVDEGQDFRPEWFEILMLFARDGADIVWLEDPDQDLRMNAPVTLAGFVGFNARFNHRSPESIARFMRKALPFAFEQANDLPGLGVAVHSYEDDREQVKLVSRTVSDLLAMGFEPEDIVILSMKGIAGTCLGDRRRVGNHTLKRFDGTYDPDGHQVFTPGQLYLESVFRFKGGQAPAVIAVDVESGSRDQARMQRILYTAFSRAAVRLDVLVKSGDPLEDRLSRAAG